MSMTDLSGADAPEAGNARTNPLYFALWRWHFYAGLYVVPFLIMLAVTGFFMMWFKTIAPEYGDRLAVEPAAQTLTLADQEHAALAAVPGADRLTLYAAPYGVDQPAMFTVVAGEGESHVVALDPYRGTALRITAEGATWNALLEEIHGTLLIGTLGDRLIEIAASLGLMLVASGLYLWWPRNGAGWRDRLLVRRGLRGRGFWKSLHSVVGLWVALVLVLFLVTGLAWTGVWGEKFVQAWSTFPAEKWDNVPLSDATHINMNHHTKEVPWALEQTPLPESTAPVTGLPAGTPVTLDSLAVLARQIGFEGRFRLNPPSDERGVWTISQDSMSYDSESPTADRTVHVDRYTGGILASVGFADYSLAGKAMAAGTALHEGQTGLWNVILNGLFCLAILVLCLSGAVMWWLRRPARTLRLVAPPRPHTVPLTGGLMLTALLLSMAFPMLGLTLLVMLALDLVILSAVPGLKRVLS